MKKTKEHTEISKLRILLAAEEEFCQHGYAGANINSIGKNAGMTKGAVFWHYKNKVMLFRAVVNRSIDKLKEMNRETFESSGDIPVIERCREVLKRLIKDKAFDILIIMTDADATGEIPKEIFAEFFDATFKIFSDSVQSLDDAKTRGELRQDTDPEAILLTINLILTGFAKIKQLKALSLPLNKQIDKDVILNMIFNGLLSYQIKN